MFSFSDNYIVSIYICINLQEWFHLKGGRHIAALHIYSSTECGSAWGFVGFFCLTSMLRRKT